MLEMPAGYTPEKVRFSTIPHNYGKDTELRILRLARTYIEKGWCQDDNHLGVKAKGPARERHYVVYSVSPIYYSQSNGFGTICHPTAEDATRWTIQGALERALYELDIPEFDSTGLSIPFFNVHMAIGATLSQTHEEWCYGFEDWNNKYGRTQAEVLVLFDHVIRYFELLQQSTTG